MRKQRERKKSTTFAFEPGEDGNDVRADLAIRQKSLKVGGNEPDDVVKTQMLIVETLREMQHNMKVVAKRLEKLESLHLARM